MREYQIEFGPKLINLVDHDCIFCKHCVDMFWDYTHGPYMLLCELNEEDQMDEFISCHNQFEKCPLFMED